MKIHVSSITQNVLSCLLLMGLLVPEINRGAENSASAVCARFWSEVTRVSAKKPLAHCGICIYPASFHRIRDEGLHACIDF